MEPGEQKEGELGGLATIGSLRELKDPSHTSVSVVTPAKVRQVLPPHTSLLSIIDTSLQVTIEVLKAAKELKVPAVWCQPGTTDETCETFIKENGMEGKVIFGGPCLLVMGDGILASL